MEPSRQACWTVHHAPSGHAHASNASASYTYGVTLANATDDYASDPFVAINASLEPCAGACVHGLFSTLYRLCSDYTRKVFASALQTLRLTIR